ncbi:MAG: c-type cytochrome [Methylacidiphilales bacterium]|nr:c-type cytochrome [Candidatus Methylacidiphilales bacterium]
MLKTIFTLLFCFAFTNAVADITKGKAIYTTRGCGSCHGPTGKSLNPAVYPALAGKPKKQLLEKFKDYRSGKIVNPFMNSMSKSVLDNEIADLFSYIETLK